MCHSFGFSPSGRLWASPGHENAMRCAPYFVVVYHYRIPDIFRFALNARDRSHIQRYFVPERAKGGVTDERLHVKIVSLQHLRASVAGRGACALHGWDEAAPASSPVPSLFINVGKRCRCGATSVPDRNG